MGQLGPQWDFLTIFSVCKYTAQNKYDDMSLYAFFYYADLYIIVEYGIFLKKIQFPVQWGANREVTTIVGDTAARWMTYPPISKVTK